MADVIAIANFCRAQFIKLIQLISENWLLQIPVAFFVFGMVGWILKMLYAKGKDVD